MTICILALGATASLVGCAKDPVVIQAPIVQICVEGVNYIRVPDADCQATPKIPSHNWVYVTYSPRFSKTIPPVGEQVHPRERFTYQRPIGKGEIVRAPEDGAVFADR